MTFAGGMVAHSPARGWGSIIITTYVPDEVTFHLSFHNLSSPTTRAEILCCGIAPAMIIDLLGFPVGKTRGSYDRTFDRDDASLFDDAFLANNGGTAQSAWASFLDYMSRGGFYSVAVYTEDPNVILSGGVGVPEPATWAMMIIGFGATGVAIRTRRRTYLPAL